MYWNVHSYFSLRYGTLNIDELITLARQNRVKTLALTDINTTMGIPEFIKKTADAGIKPIAGAEIRNNNRLLFIALARNNAGFKELNDYLSWHYLNKKEFSAGGWQFNHVTVVYPPGHKNPLELK
jgi:DNA polymerase III alpha subunit